MIARAFIQAQQPRVHEDAGQPVAHGAVEQRGDHRGIDAAGDRALEREHAVAERKQCERRGHRESEPRSERTGQPGLREPDADAGLAGRGPGHELEQCDQIGVGPVVDPRAVHDEGLAEVAQVRGRATAGSNIRCRCP